MLHGFTALPVQMCSANETNTITQSLLQCDLDQEKQFKARQRFLIFLALILVTGCARDSPQTAWAVVLAVLRRGESCLEGATNIGLPTGRLSDTALRLKLAN